MENNRREMESAIPDHLIVERQCPRRAAPDHVPTFDSYVARFDPTVRTVSVGYFGVQYRDDRVSAAHEALRELAQSFSLSDGPARWERAHHIDAQGFENTLFITYWTDTPAFERWFASHGARWTADERTEGSVGYFSEILTPPVDRYETLFSAADRPEGIGAAGVGLSGAVVEHGYWGGMRDRIPLSQTDTMEPVGASSTVLQGRRVRVVPSENVCLIRSGQDWSDTEGDERAMYLNEVEPILRNGMTFLRDEGKACDCYANRYMTIVDEDGRPKEKTFAMSWWRGLGDLEAWARTHPTHAKIFGVAMKYFDKYNDSAKLRLFHEVSVVSAQHTHFEYLNCHPKTGMLNSLPQ